VLLQPVAESSFERGHCFVECRCCRVLEDQSAGVKRTGGEATPVLLADFDPTAALYRL
jgi:hypothetical protein